MNLFDNLILQLQRILQNHQSIFMEYNPARILETLSENLIVLRPDTAIELGAEGYDSTSFTLTTTDSSLVQGDGVRLLGEDIPGIRENSCFGKIILIQCESFSDDDNEAYKQIRDIDFMKYKLYINGYMSRISNERSREHIRISKDAYNMGISLEFVGNTIIKRYKTQSLVRNVQVWFITKQISGFMQLVALALKAKQISSGMNYILNEMILNCFTCNLKSVCDEVQELRDLHEKISVNN